MTQEEISQLARQAGLFGTFVKYKDEIEIFANLVAKHTLMNIDPSKFISCQEVMEAARMAEREACAKVIESHGETLANGAMLVEAIRARGEA
jgi:hypothetical protein